MIKENDVKIIMFVIGLTLYTGFFYRSGHCAGTLDLLLRVFVFGMIMTQVRVIIKFLTRKQIAGSMQAKK